MTYEQFWEQDCELVKYYRKAAQIRQDLKNQDAWLQGAYFYEALCDAAPIFHSFARKGTKATPYRDKPFEVFSRQNEQGRSGSQKRQNDEGVAFMQAFALSINQKFQEKGGGVNG